jgi:hypothetical protein
MQNLRVKTRRQINYWYEYKPLIFGLSAALFLKNSTSPMMSFFSSLLLASAMLIVWQRMRHRGYLP